MSAKYGLYSSRELASYLKIFKTVMMAINEIVLAVNMAGTLAIWNHLFSLSSILRSRVFKMRLYRSFPKGF